MSHKSHQMHQTFLHRRKISGDIIYSMDQDDVVVFGIIIVFNDLIVETFYQCIIGQFAFSQFHKKMLIPPSVSCSRGNSMFIRFFPIVPERDLRKISKYLNISSSDKERNASFSSVFYSFSVNVTSADAGERTVLGSELFLDFRNFFFVHIVLYLMLVCSLL